MYRDHLPKSEVDATIDDIARFLGRYGKNEATLQKALERVFHPEVVISGWDGLTTREWLVDASTVLSDVW